MGMEGVEVFPKTCFAKEDWFCGIFVGATWGRGEPQNFSGQINLKKACLNSLRLVFYFSISTTLNTQSEV